MKFLHTADWQIGMKAAHVGDVAEAVREERLQAARRVVQAAERHGADFILVAGDTFENNAVDSVLVQKVADLLAEFSGPVYLIPGNHDPLVPGAVWDHPAWRSHARLHTLAEPKPLEIDGGVLYPSPLCVKHSFRDPTLWMDARQSQRIAIGLAHGTVQGVAQEELDWPISREAAVRAGLDYLALGHWHSTVEYADSAGATRMAYSGTHEPTKFGERESGNVLLVEIEERGRPPKIVSLRAGGLAWRQIEVDVREPGDLLRLRESIEEMDQPRATLLDIRLAGVLHPHDHAELTRVREIVESRFLFGRIDDSRLLPQPQDDGWLVNVPVGVLREVAERLRELSDPAFAGDRPDGATPEVAARALVELYALVNEVDS